jgi:peptide/nickel transport system permease protein
VRSYLSNPRTVFGSGILLTVLVLAVLPGLFLNHDPASSDLTRRLQPPAWETGDWGYPLGADALGRDLWGRLVVGARITVTISISAVLVSGLIGALLGLLSGYHGGKLDSLIAAVTEVQLAFPFILLAITIIAVRGPDTITLVLTMALSGWVVYARVIRSRVLSIRELEFIEAARAVGCRTPRILWHHVLPQLTAPITVIATLEVARMILLESALSFLGLGVQAPDVSWGQIISDGRQYIATAWWVTALPGFAIALTVLAVNSFGDWLSEALDPSASVTS